MSRNLSVTSVKPNAGIAGGEVMVYLLGVAPEMLATLGVRFGSADAHLVSVNASRALALIPEVAGEAPVSVTADNVPPSQSTDGSAQFTIGKRLARSLHPVANPAFNPADGSLFVTRSGS